MLYTIVATMRLPECEEALDVERLQQPPIRAGTGRAIRVPADVRLDYSPARPRVIRLPADWWDSPSAIGCPLSCGLQSARVARRLTRNALREWDLTLLADDAETIVTELVANAVTHGARLLPHRKPAEENLGLRLLRPSGVVICAVLDPSDSAPVPRAPGGVEEAGRGLQLVDAISDVWGWSPVAGRGKAVWAILFAPPPVSDKEG
jgi:hypothetical protein